MMSQSSSESNMGPPPSTGGGRIWRSYGRVRPVRTVGTRSISTAAPRLRHGDENRLVAERDGAVERDLAQHGEAPRGAVEGGPGRPDGDAAAGTEQAAGDGVGRLREPGALLEPIAREAERGAHEPVHDGLQS